MKTIKITKGNDFVLYIPLVLLNSTGVEIVDTERMSNVSVVVKNNFSGAILNVTPQYVENFMVLSFDETLTLGAYDFCIKFKYDGVDKALSIDSLIKIVKYDSDSNWRDYIVGDHVETDTQAFVVGSFLTDEDYARLKAELSVKIAEADAAKEEYERRAMELEGVAQETTSQQILSAVSGVAQQGGDPNATNTAIYQLIEQEGIQRANEYAAEIREIIGDWS